MAALDKAVAQGVLDAQGTVLGIANAVILAIEGHRNGLRVVKVLLIGHALSAQVQIGVIFAIESDQIHDDTGGKAAVQADAHRQGHVT